MEHVYMTYLERRIARMTDHDRRAVDMRTGQIAYELKRLQRTLARRTYAIWPPARHAERRQRWPTVGHAEPSVLGERNGNPQWPRHRPA
jgi:hypothetical protein